MWSSFTKDEKKLFIFLLLFLGLGSLGLMFFDQRRNTQVFTARTAGDGRIQNPPTWQSSGKSGVSSSANASQSLLDLNTASEAELVKLPGIGKARAEAIVSYREAHGPFASVQDLRKIHGIGPATLRGLEGWVTVGERSAGTTQTQSSQPVLGFTPAPQRAPASLNVPSAGNSSNTATPPTPSQTILDLNTATVAELADLEQIGPVLAQRIVDYRNRNGRFQRLEDLDKVPGIGKKRIELNRHRLIVR